MAAIQPISSPESFLKPAVGHPVWGVRLDPGSFFTFEIGAETPRSTTANPTAVAGEWHFWIYMCTWRLLNESDNVLESTDTASNKHLPSQLEDFLRGRVFRGVRPDDPAGLMIDFDQDLCIQLKAMPQMQEEPLLMVYFGEEKVLSLRGDRHFAYEPASAKFGEEQWRIWR